MVSVLGFDEIITSVSLNTWTIRADVLSPPSHTKQAAGASDFEP